MALKKNTFACAKDKIKLYDLREKYRVASRRRKRLRFFDELNEDAQQFAIRTERDGGTKATGGALAANHSTGRAKRNITFISIFRTTSRTLHRA